MRRHPNRESGLSLLEVIAAMSLSAIICTSLLPLVALGVKTQQASRQLFTEGLQRWNAVHSAMLEAPYSPDPVWLMDWDLGPVLWRPPGEGGEGRARVLDSGYPRHRKSDHVGETGEVTP